MKTHFLRAWTFTLVLSLVSIIALPVWGQGATADMAVVRIRDFAKTLDLIDEWGASANNGQAVTLPVRSLIGNTDWIDPNKSAVIMASLDQDMPTAYAIVPFVRPSQAFAQMTQAQAGPGYYLVAYPPTGPVPGHITQALIAEVGKPASKDTISLKIPAASLVEKMEPMISQTLQQAGQTQPQGTDGLSSQDAQHMADGMINLFKQIKTLSIGATISDSKVGFSFEGLAVPGTDLADLLSKQPPQTARLANYKPSGAITYRTRPFDMESFSTLFTDQFASVYASMGMDLRCLDIAIAELTGEYVAGVTFEGNAMLMEGIYCVKDPIAASMVIDKIIGCSVDMSSNLGKRPQMPGTATWKHAKDSNVAGLDVNGMKAVFAKGDASADNPAFDLDSMELRLASKDGLIFVASSDSKLAQVIRKAKRLKPGKATGPTLEMEMDFASFMTQFGDAGKQMPKPFPPATMTISMNLAGGKGRTEMSMNPNQAREMVQYLAKLSPQGGAGTTGFTEEPSPAWGENSYPAPEAETFEPAYMEPLQTPEQIRDQKVAKIVERGNLSAMYGGPKAAIKTYERALKMDPDSPVAHFAMALAYSELGEYQSALDHTDMALDARPDNPVYMYGRARILLLSGQDEEALEEFVTAANSGSVDAQNYLDLISSQ